MFMACLGFLGVRLGSTVALINPTSFQTWEAALSWHCLTTCSRAHLTCNPCQLLSRKVEGLGLKSYESRDNNDLIGYSLRRWYPGESRPQELSRDVFKPPTNIKRAFLKSLTLESRHSLDVRPSGGAPPSRLLYFQCRAYDPCFSRPSSYALHGRARASSLIK